MVLEVHLANGLTVADSQRATVDGGFWMIG